MNKNQANDDDMYEGGEEEDDFYEKNTKIKQ
jgi:hypothetical protein